MENVLTITVHCPSCGLDNQLTAVAEMPAAEVLYCSGCGGYLATWKELKERMSNRSELTPDYRAGAWRAKQDASNPRHFGRAE